MEGESVGLPGGAGLQKRCGPAWWRRIVVHACARAQLRRRPAFPSAQWQLSARTPGSPGPPVHMDSLWTLGAGEGLAGAGEEVAGAGEGDAGAGEEAAGEGEKLVGGTEGLPEGSGGGKSGEGWGEGERTDVPGAV